jgi:hypothetical protein
MITTGPRYTPHPDDADEDAPAGGPEPSMPASERELRVIAARAGYPSWSAFAVAAGVGRRTVRVALRTGTCSHGVNCKLAVAAGVPLGVITRVWDLARAETAAP